MLFGLFDGLLPFPVNCSLAEGWRGLFSSDMFVSPRKLAVSLLSALSLSSDIQVSRSSTYVSSPFGTGVYNSSQTPANLPWNTYNYCNAPHVNAAHYFKPALANASGFDGQPELVYVNAMIRDHKVSDLL